MAWQAIAAFAGLFTLFSALANPVDLWRITVRSHQGEPLKAVAALDALPEERITQDCLSLGTESDAPRGDAPFLTRANLKLNAAGNAVEITTDAPISSPTLELVLRVQCPGVFFSARHFSVLIPPAATAAASGKPAKGFRLKVGSGETVESLAATVLPGDRRRQRQLVREVIAGNPELFPNGKAGPIPAGTILLFPELRSLALRTPKPSAPVATRVPAAASVPAAKTPVTPVPKRPKPSQASAAPREPAKLRQALDLGEKPGPQECRQLLPLCGAVDSTAVAPPPPGLDRKTGELESGVQALRLKQDGLDSQLARLEHALTELQKVIEARPAMTAPQPAPKPKIRTVVKTEYKASPMPWYFWLGLAIAALAAAAAGFLFGRRRAYSESLADSNGRLDEMLASAADAMRDLDHVPRSPPRLPPLPPVSPARTMRDADMSDVNGTVTKKPEVPDMALDTQMMQATNVDLELDSGAAEKAGGKPEELSTDLAFEMDQALDNTRSMFTDVDRFIALGRTQNALSLLQFQVVKDPKDRDSWIKLMAIYRQERMDAELEKALRDFKKNFPHENPPAG